MFRSTRWRARGEAPPPGQSHVQVANHLGDVVVKEVLFRAVRSYWDADDHGRKPGAAEFRGLFERDAVGPVPPVAILPCVTPRVARS